MGYRRLYIIGNGFDLHYGIKSGYKDYLNYLESHDGRLFEVLFNLFPASIWKNFEEDLGALRPGALNADLFRLIVHDSDSDYSWERESASLNYHYSAMREELDIERISRTFKEWVNQIDISCVKTDSVIRDTEDTVYLTFNYTRTLEDCFGIDESRILHIHGKVGDSGLVIGHASIENKAVLPPQPYYEQDMLEELRLRFIDRTEKPVSSIIAKNSGWFESLKDVDEVIVSGFSFSDVDLPYIQKVVASIRQGAEWKVYTREPIPFITIPIVGDVGAIRYPQAS